jgi:phosphopantothenoylcysteine synthetase/decarboxylase
VLNAPDAGIGSETNMVTLVESHSALELPEASKREVAEHIFDRIHELRDSGKDTPSLKLAGTKKAKPR